MKNAANNEFNAIYSKNYSMVLNIVRQKVRNSDDAEELANDVFLKVYKYLNIFDSNKSNFKTWLFNITKNAVIDYYRKTKDLNQLINIGNFVDENGKELFQFIDESKPIDNVETTELATSLNSSFDALKEPYKSVAKLFFVEQKQYNEIADLLNIPLNTVKVTLMRAKAKLQEQLQAEYQELN